MRVLLVIPPNPVANTKPLGQYTLATSPLGLAYIAAILEENGFSTNILDLSFPGLGTKKFCEKITKFKPNIVGISSMASNFQTAIQIAKQAKIYSPSSTVVMGGVHATFLHREILANVAEVDVIVRFEGEQTMTELADALDKGFSLKSIKGISYRNKGRLLSTPLRCRIEDLDTLPYPAHHLLEPNIEDYLKSYGKRNFPVITTRGCPFGCVFCSTMAFHGRKYRVRSIPNVIGELEYLIEKFKAEDISFADDNFTMLNDRVYALCKAIKEKSLPISWGCSARVDQVSEELLRAMKGAGCTDIFFGIESTSDRVLNLVKKRFTLKQAKKAVRICEEMGIKTHCSFILGLPGETKKSLSGFVSFLEETKPSGRVLPNILKILPGTELMQREEELFSNQKRLSPADITKTQLEILTKFYEMTYGVTELFRVIPPNLVFE